MNRDFVIRLARAAGQITVGAWATGATLYSIAMTVAAVAGWFCSPCGG
jgi:hypothetical protein